MFQIGAIGSAMNSDTSTPGWFSQAFRGLFSMLDVAVYSLIVVIYEILFNIADSTFISSNTVRAFYGRVQLILGVFMIFKLSISLLHAVINPDYLTDQKKGMGQMITRIIVMLVMFSAMIPLRIPLTQSEINAVKDGKVKSFNYHLNQSGLLFGTLYSLQERILKGNVLVKLFLGDNSNKYEMTEEGNSGLEESANKLAIYVIKGFVRINLSENATGKGKISEKDYICSSANGGDDYSSDEREQLNNYIEAKTVTDVVNLDNMTEICNDSSNPGGWLIAKVKGQDEYWMFTYTPIISTICGVLLLLILIGYCIDIAVRVLKLAVLRLIAPIPIISYVDPKSSENGSFAAWVKSLTSTYIDLFIRLGIVYFAVFIVQDICEHGIDIPIANGIVGILSSIFIIIGIFYFLRMAPKFIRDALGLKGIMSNIGLSGMLAGAGALASGGSLADARDAARASRKAQTDAFREGKQAPPLMSNFTSGRDLMAQYKTGNPKMTHDQMKRGRAHMARDGITEANAEDTKNRMYALKDEAEMLKNINDKINRGGYNSLTDSEKQMLEAEYRANHGITKGPLSAAQLQEMKESAMDSYLKKQTKAGITEAQYNMMQKEMDAFGVSPGYKEKYHSTRTDARVSDLFSASGRAAVRGTSRAQTARNVAGMPGAGRRARQDDKYERTANKTIDRGNQAADANSRVNQSRNRNNNP